MTMTAAFSEWAAANLPGVTWTGLDVKLTVLVRSAVLDDQDATQLVLPYDTLSELLAAPGWQAVSGDQSNTAAGGSLATATVSTTGGVTEIGGSLGFSYASVAPVFATGFALSLDRAAPDDNLICVFQPLYPVYLTGDPANNLNWSKIKPPDSGDGGYLFSFLTALEEGSCNPQLGSISISVPTLEWEDARAAHVWLDPQRINYAVNPSFEASGAGTAPYGWRSNTTMTKERGGIRPPQGMTPQSRQFCARLTGAEDPKVLESSMFPTGREAQGEWWSVEAAVSGAGRARVGIVFWPATMQESGTTYVHTDWFDLSSDFGYAAPEDPEDEVIHQGEFRVLKALIHTPELAYEGMFRLEFEGAGDVWVDNVLVEPNEAQAGYFDGDWEFGQVGDFSWYTGTGVQDVNDPHKTFSLFYNNRRAVRASMVDAPEGDPPQYHVLSWVPEGASVVVHWDDVYSIRLHSWIDDVYIPTPDYPDNTVVTSIGSLVPITTED